MVTLLLFHIDNKWRVACNVHVWTVAPPSGEQQHLMQLKEFWGTAQYIFSNWPLSVSYFLYLCIYIVFVILDTIHTLCDFIDVFLTAQLL